MINSYPYPNRPTTDVEYSLLYRWAFNNWCNGIISNDRKIGDNFKTTINTAGIKVNSGKAVINGFMFIKDNVNTDNPALNTDNGNYSIVIRIHQSADDPNNRAELLQILTSDIMQVDTGNWDYELYRFTLNNGNVSNLTDKRTLCGINFSDIQGNLDISKVVGTIPFSTRVSGTVPINRGGTGQTNGVSGFNALGTSAEKGHKLIDVYSTNGLQQTRYSIQSPADAGNGIWINKTGSAEKITTNVLQYDVNNARKFALCWKEGTGFTIGASKWFSGAGSNVKISSAGNIVKQTSSIKYKKDIKNFKIHNPYNILKIKPVTFRYKNTDNNTEKIMGLIAEQVKDIKGLEHLLIKDKNGIVDGIDYEKIAIYQNELIKDLVKRIDALEQKSMDRQNGNNTRKSIY
jgi:hypothetical protein